jgi:RHS repeat-associated protein
MEKTKGTDKRIVTMKYDPQGRRIEKQIITTADGVTKTETYAYIYDNDNIILEVYTDENSTITKTFYTHGAGTDEHLALERNGQNYYYHADGLGSITTITDINRTIVQSYSYDSFGMIKAQTGFANRYTYTGREWDKETGLYYYRDRYYDSMDGKFVSKDPIGFKGGDVNLFAYTKNNPINYKDPSGKSMIGDLFDWAKWGADAAVVHKIADQIAKDEDKSIDALLKGHCEEAQIYRDEAIALRILYDELINKLSHNPPPGTTISNPGSSGR